tara:strand:+ start:7617 stop:7844 length:228 start_codon:yes stop_codon:yes gene_type:complete
MSELSVSAKLRMMAKGLAVNGDVISADRLARLAIQLDEEKKQPTIADYIKDNEAAWKKCHRSMVNISELKRIAGV